MCVQFVMQCIVCFAKGLSAVFYCVVTRRQDTVAVQKELCEILLYRSGDDRITV